MDKGVLRLALWSEVKPSTRVISSRVVRMPKGEDIKCRIVLRDFRASYRPEGGELFAATPSLPLLRLLLTGASVRRNQAVQHGGPGHGLLIGDVSQAFVHADIDDSVATAIPIELAGLELKVNSVTRFELAVLICDWI